MGLVAYQHESWEAVCEQIQAELTVVGAWHLEDELSATVRQTSELEDGRVYRVREMAALTCELLRSAHDNERHALETQLNHGMNVELHRDRLQARCGEREPEPEPVPAVRNRPYQVWVRCPDQMRLHRAHTVAELYEQVARQLQVRSPFMLTHCGREVEELAECITVDVTFRLLGGAEIEQKFRIEGVKRVWSEVVHPGETVSECRERAKAKLTPRERVHALQVYIMEALLDDADDMADWCDADVTLELRATEARDFTWTDDPEPEPAPAAKSSWTPMSKEEI
jgi:hypothetical protein